MVCVVRAEAAELLLELNHCLEVLWLYPCYAVPELKNALRLRLDLYRCPGIPGTVNLRTRWTSCGQPRVDFLNFFYTFRIQGTPVDQCNVVCNVLSSMLFYKWRYFCGKLLQYMLWFFSKVRFDSIGGLSHHILALKEMVVFPLLYPEIFEKFKIQPPR